MSAARIASLQPALERTSRAAAAARAPSARALSMDPQSWSPIVRHPSAPMPRGMRAQGCHRPSPHLWTRGSPKRTGLADSWPYPLQRRLPHRSHTRRQPPVGFPIGRPFVYGQGGHPGLKGHRRARSLRPDDGMLKRLFRYPPPPGPCADRHRSAGR